MTKQEIELTLTINTERVQDLTINLMGMAVELYRAKKLAKGNEELLRKLADVDYVLNEVAEIISEGLELDD